MTRAIVTFEPLETRAHLCVDHVGETSPAITPSRLTSVDAAASPSLAWSSKSTLSLRRDEAAGAAVNGKLYVFGGFHDGKWTATKRVDAYDVANNRWSRLRDMPEALTHSATAVRGNTVWIVGGYLGQHPGPAVRSVYKYDVATDTYSAGPSLPFPRGAGAASIVGNTLHYFAGTNRPAAGAVAQQEDKGTLYTLDLTQSGAKWVQKATMPDARNHIAGATINGKIYAVGGQYLEGGAAQMLTRVDAYDPATNSWSRVASLPAPVSHMLASTFAYGGHILVVGGESSHNVSRSDLFAYNPTTDRWFTAGQLPQARRSPVGGIFGTKLILTTGSYSGGRQTGDTISATLPSSYTSSPTSLISNDRDRRFL